MDVPAAGTAPGSEPTQGAATTGPTLFSLIPDDLKASPGLLKFEKADLPTFAKSYLELDKLRNERTGIKPLAADSTPEDVAAYRKAMGIPEKPDGYEFGELSFP